VQIAVSQVNAVQTCTFVQTKIGSNLVARNALLCQQVGDNLRKWPAIDAIEAIHHRDFLSSQLRIINPHPTPWS
jgi:hypothetical protein